MLRLLIRVPGSVAIKATEQGTRLGVRGGYVIRNAEAFTVESVLIVRVKEGRPWGAE